MEKSVTEAINYRRSVRVYKNKPIDTEKVKGCLKNAVLAPTSSNLQLWEFYHVTDKDVLKQLSVACMNQPAARTAQQLVVVIANKSLWRKHAKANIEFLNKSFKKPNLEESLAKRKKMVFSYYKKLIPTLYSEFLGVLGYLKYFTFQIVGLFRPVYRQTRLSDMRIVAHKSAALAAQNFMISMAAIGYDTCPMEGSDTLRIKKILNISRKAEVNMVIGCGTRDDAGVYGPRFRVPFEEVYHSI
ncbi:MAG: nitroreductase family protein [Flavobacteriaceae bacterium]|nr:nitroreductase family protein [Bacteroidia bacterium]NNL15925.1 nitroreductase family protein [Flavobacteriaceae bacterium]